MVQRESGSPRGIQRPPERPGRQRHPASASKSGGGAQHLAPSISRFTRCIVPLPAPVSRMTLRMLSPAASRRRICASTSVRGRPCGFFSVPILLAAESSALGATIPFNSVMIATFFLTGLDISLGSDSLVSRPGRRQCAGLPSPIACAPPGLPASPGQVNRRRRQKTMDRQFAGTRRTELADHQRTGRGDPFDQLGADRRASCVAEITQCPSLFHHG